LEAGGKEERFNRLIVPHLDAVRNLAGWLTGEEADAADLVQDTFLRAFRFFDQLRGESVKPWLLKILRNTHYSRLKAAGRTVKIMSMDEAQAEVARVSGTDGDASLAGDPEALLLRAEDRDLIRRAMFDLSEDQRMILVLREVEGFPYKDIAKILDVPVGTVMSRLGRARKMLSTRVSCIAQEAGNGSRRS
jgi:RNA polymerase sigma-70 factor (ECF subfamily)